MYFGNPVIPPVLMNKKILLPVILLFLIGACFIPVTLQKSTIIKSPFLNTYSLLAKPSKWEEWCPELRKAMKADSDKIIMRDNYSAFTIKYNRFNLEVKPKGNSFNINELINGKSTNYSYVLAPVPDKFLNKTIVFIVEKTNAINYLKEKFVQPDFLDEHLNYLKNYLETDSLLYGFNIFKTGVPDSTLIVVRRKVLSANKFTEAAKMLASLKDYVKTNNIRQTQPLIAQFLQIAKDSMQVNVGFFINREVKPVKGIEFDRMPKGGPFYAARFRGRFYQRGKIYQAMRQYFNNHSLQAPLLPIETYLDNKLPVNDSDLIYMQLNFPTFPEGKGQ